MHRECAKDEEAQLLAGNTVPVPVTPIRYPQLWKAAKTWEDAFEFDPLILYMRAGVKPSHFARRTQKFYMLLSLKRRKTILTVNGGSAFVAASPEIDVPKTPFELLFEFLATQAWRILIGEPTAEQQKRLEEAGHKIQSVIDATIGDRITDAVFLGPLATEPASQRRGYGGALVEAVNDMADSRGKASCLLTITTNEPFYNSHGYKTVGTFYMGEGNPNWEQKPIAVNLMVRETRNKLEISSLKSTKVSNLKLILNPF